MKFVILDFFKSGQRILVKKNSVKEIWYKKKSLKRLKPPDLINISGSGIDDDFNEFLKNLSLILIDLFNNFAAERISSLPL